MGGGSKNVLQPKMQEIAGNFTKFFSLFGQWGLGGVKMHFNHKCRIFHDVDKSIEFFFSLFGL